MKIKEVFFHSWIKYLICLIYGIIILVVNNSLRDWITMANYSNGFFVAGFSLLCFGCLSIINNLGGFDIFSHLFAKKDEKGVKPSFYDYSLKKQESRKKSRYSCVPYFTVGVLYLILSIIMLYIR